MGGRAVKVVLTDYWRQDGFGWTIGSHGVDGRRGPRLEYDRWCGGGDDGGGGDRGWVHPRAALADHRVEPVDRVRRVVHCAHRTVRLYQGVLPLQAREGTVTAGTELQLRLSKLDGTTGRWIQ